MKRLCPYCGEDIPAQSAISGDFTLTPKEGDLSTCANCLNHSIYTADLQLRRPTLEENIALVNDVERWNDVLKAKAIIMAVRKKRYL